MKRSNKARVILLLMFTFLGGSLFCQEMQFEWNKVLGTSGNNTGKCILRDDEGSIYVAGEFKEDFSFGDDTISGYGANNAFILKMSEFGELIWAETFGGDGTVNLRGMSFDREMDLVCTGSFLGVLTVNDTSITSHGGSDIYIFKMSPSGDWIKILTDGGTGGEFAFSLDFDQNNNLYICGSFLGESAFGNLSLVSSGEWIWTPWGSEYVYIENAFYARYNPDLNCDLAKQICGNESQLYSIVLDSQDNIYTTGYFSATDELNDTIAGTTGKFLIFKYNPAGQLIGFIQEGSWNAYIKGNAMATDSEDNLYVAGYIGCPDCIFGDSLLPDAYNDAFLVKYNADGAMQWINLIGQYHGDYDGNENSAKSIFIDEEDRVYLAGYFDGIVWNGIEITSMNDMLDFMVVKTLPDGLIESIGTYGYPSWDSGEGITLDSSGHIYLTGYTYLDHFFSNEPSYIFIGKVDSILSVAIPELKSADQVSIYPNPSNGLFNLDLPSGFDHDKTLIISNLEGKYIYEAGISDNHLEIDLSMHKPGLYYLMIKTGERLYCKKLVKL